MKANPDNSDERIASLKLEIEAIKQRKEYQSMKDNILICVKEEKINPLKP